MDEHTSSTRRIRLSPHATVVLVLVLTMWVESGISFGLMFGALRTEGVMSLEVAWVLLRLGSVLAVLFFWARGQKRRLFQAIVFANVVLSLGLVASTGRLIDVLVVQAHLDAVALLVDVVRLAVVNVLSFSIWYWIIDPPGIDEAEPASAPWEILFPQRVSPVPGHETWAPRYTDYLYLAFTTSMAFSPTDALPLTRRAKA